MPETRIANWRRRPEDPKGSWGWIVWGDRHLSAPRRRLLRNLTLAAAAIALAIGLAWSFEWLFVFIPVAWFALALLARPGAREHAALPVLGGAEAFPVMIEIWHGRRRTGRESGWIAFVDGWLVYEGLRTAFSFRPCDVRFGGKGQWRQGLWFPDGRMMTVAILNDFMQTNRPGGWNKRSLLNDALNEWHNAPSPEGDPVLPPQELSLRLRGERVAELSAGSTVLVALAVLFALSEFFLGALLALAGASLCALLAVRGWLSLREALARGSEFTDAFAIESGEITTVSHQRD